MTTTTSYSNKDRFFSLYKSTLRRNAGYFGLISALILIFYPFQYAMEAFKRIDPEQISGVAADLLRSDPYYFYSFFGLGKNFTGVSAFFFTVLVLLAPLVLALVLNSFMHSKKASDVYHALPLKRGTLLAVNAAAAMTMIFAPVVVSNVLISIMQAAKFGFDAATFGYLWLDAAGWLVAALTIYAVTCFVSVCVGTVFDTFVQSGVLLMAVPAIVGLCLLLSDTFLYGWMMSDLIRQNIFLLSPVTFMPARFALDGVNGSLAAEAQRVLLHSNIALLVYLLLALLVFWLATRLYTRRLSEIAESTTSRGVLQIIIKMIGVLISSIVVGFLFYMLGYSSGRMTFIMWAAIGGILAYAIIEVVFNRGFKTLIRSLPLGVLMVAVAIGVSGIFMTGGFGYEKRVPHADQIASVEIGYRGRYGSGSAAYSLGPVVDEYGRQNTLEVYDNVTLEQPENIGAVLTAHQELITRHNAGKDHESETTVWTSVRVVYHLKNGRTLSRVYRGVPYEVLKLLEPLETAEELLNQVHPAFFTDSKNVSKWTISDAFGSKKYEPVYSAADTQKLLDAIKSDLLALTLDDLADGAMPLAVVEFNVNAPEDGSERFSSYGYFHVTDRSQQTYRFLEEKGVFSQIETDLDNCIGVIASPSTDTYVRYNGSVTGAIIQIVPDDYQFSASAYESEKQAAEEERESLLADGYKAIPYRQYLAQQSGEEEPVAASYIPAWRTVFEDEGTIQAMTDALCATYDAGEPLVFADFYFSDSSTGRQVMLPLSRLPQDVQDQFQSYMLEDASVTVAERAAARTVW